MDTATEPTTRELRGAFIGAALKAERWSIRAAALAIGTNHTSLGARVKGETPFLAEDIEALAYLLKRDPVAFYAEYLQGGTQNGPASEETGPTRVVPPTGIEPATIGTNDRRLIHFPRGRRDRSTGPKRRAA